MDNEVTAAVQAESVNDRSAQSYVDAMNAVIDIAEFAISFIPGGTAASKVARYAPKAIKVARGAAAAVPAVAPVAAPVAQKVAEHMPGVVDGAIKGAADAVGSAAGAAGEAIGGFFDARAQERARREARKTILDGAGIRMSVETFLENWETCGKLEAGASSDYLNYCGCYVIATYSSTVRKGDFSTFRDLYVGRSENIGSAVKADVSGSGNPDVYADVKYKQHVYVMLYPCKEGQLDKLEASLIAALDADCSYNKGRVNE